MGHRIFDGMIMNGYEVDTSQTAESGTVMVGDEEISVRDLITDEDIQQIFEEDFLTTKDDILRDIDSLLKSIARNKDEDSKRSQAYYKRYVDLVERFRDKIMKNTFPRKLEEWWYYEYEVHETGMVLYLNHSSKPHMDNEGNITFLSVDTSFELLKVSTKMLTVEQYAKANDVTTTTVRQWIRRGKLRTAVKQGGEWRIPELAEIKERGYTFVQYKWDEYLTGFPEKYEFVNNYALVTISQNKEQKNMFDISFCRKRRKNIAAEYELQLDIKEKEKLELLFISDPFVSLVDENIPFSTVTRGIPDSGQEFKPIEL